MDYHRPPSTGNGGGYRAIIYPILDEPYFLQLTADPTLTWNIFGGCLNASMPCVLTDRQRASLDLARVEVYGMDGLPWGGFVWDKPTTGSPLVALGPDCGLAMGPHVQYTSNGTASGKLAAMFADTDSVPTWLLPAGAQYRAYMLGSGYSITAPNVVDLDPIAAIQALQAYQNFDFGWYSEWVGGKRMVLPHFTPRSTTPDYVLALRDASQLLDGGNMDPLASAVRVVFNGGSSAVNVYDTDPTHTLVRLGRVKWATLEVTTTDSGAATTAGGAYLTQAGKDQIKASVTAYNKWNKKKHTAKQRKAYDKAHPGPTHAQRKQFASDLVSSKSAGRSDFGTYAVAGAIPAGLIRSINGGTVPYDSIRPGQMLRMFTPSGPKDATIRELSITGTSATITVDNAPNRLDILLSRIASKVKK